MLNFLNTDRSSDNLRMQSSEGDLKHVILAPCHANVRILYVKPAVQGSAMEVVELGRG